MLGIHLIMFPNMEDASNEFVGNIVGTWDFFEFQDSEMVGWNEYNTSLPFNSKISYRKTVFWQ